MYLLYPGMDALLCDGEVLEVVNHFPYLVTIIRSSSKIDYKIANRIKKANLFTRSVITYYFKFKQPHITGPSNALHMQVKVIR